MIHPDFKKIENYLSSVEKPGRYIGGEFGSYQKQITAGDFSIALSYPDLYEIAMSNLGIKYLYSYFNEMENLRCERVFAPATDLEKILRENNIRLFFLVKL